MKHVTDYAYCEEAGWVVGTYCHNSETGQSSGCILVENKKTAKTPGTFDISIYHGKIVCSTADGITVYSSNLEVLQHYSIGISYKHYIHLHTLFSASKNGEYWIVDLEKHTCTKKRLICKGEDCIGDVWSVFATESLLYLGCDMGTLTVINRQTGSYTNYALESGVTLILFLSNILYIGTYTGLYKGLPNNSSSSSSGLPSHLDISPATTAMLIVWRMHRVSIRSQVYVVVTQSFDGVGVYASDMAELLQIPTEDLVYAIRVEGCEESATVIGYEYYTGKKIEFNLYKELVQAGKIK